MQHIFSEQQLREIAYAIRKDIIRVLARNKGHTAGTLSVVDILTALYFSVLEHRPREPLWPARDRFFMSKQHANLAWYATLAHAGYFAKNILFNQKFPEHLTPAFCSPIKPGQGLSIAIGSALAARLDNSSHHVYCILGDGEHNQGQIWEAILFAGKHKLGNLTAIIDRNQMQEEGFTEEVMPLESLRAKYEAFNWKVLEVDGHHMQHLTRTLRDSKNSTKPTAVIAYTTPGKGVRFLENDPAWHSKPLTPIQEPLALISLQEEKNG